ncbi:MAG: nucleotidyltransferase domain-containing protein [Thermodesulfobacteriota bacterium]|nr:nucleotidyltransferase domain-containing protein [Thermodesulfobacteriota bacterium]
MNKDKDIYLDQVRKLLLGHLKGYRFQLFLFGSQSTERAGRTSDIDVGILPISPLPKGLLSKIREELEESSIPYFVDLVDLSRSNPDFARHVKEEGIMWN